MGQAFSRKFRRKGWQKTNVAVFTYSQELRSSRTEKFSRQVHPQTFSRCQLTPNKKTQSQWNNWFIYFMLYKSIDWNNKSWTTCSSRIKTKCCSSLTLGHGVHVDHVRAGVRYFERVRWMRPSPGRSFCAPTIINNGINRAAGPMESVNRSRKPTGSNLCRLFLAVLSAVRIRWNASASSFLRGKCAHPCDLLLS